MEELSDTTHTAGDRVTLMKYYETENHSFYPGHKFIIQFVHLRMIDVIDECGNRLSVLDKHLT